MACVLLSPTLIWAQPTPDGGEFRVNDITALDQRDAQVASDAEGNFVVVWEDGLNNGAGQDGSSRGVVGRRFDSSGNPLGPSFLINTDTLGNQDEPAVAMDPDGNFVVVWTDGDSFGGDGDGDGDGMAARLYNSDGTPKGDQFRVNAITTYQQTRAKVAMNNDGDFVVAWGNFNEDGADLYARLFDSAGNPAATEFVVNTPAPGRQYLPDLGFSDNGNFVVVWESAIDDDEDYDIIMRRYDSLGNALGPETTVNTYTTGEQERPSLAVRGDGSFVVAWGSDDVDGNSDGVSVRMFDSAGNPTSTEFTANTYTTSSQRAAAVSMDDAGNFTVVWASFRQDGDGRGVFGQQFDSAGTPLGGEFQVNTYTPNDQGYGFRGPDIAMDPDGNYVVTWADSGGFNGEGQDGDGDGVYAQRYLGVDTTLVGHWPLDEGNGTTTVNNGVANDGTLENGAAWTDGQASFAGAFDGADDIIRVVDPGLDSPLDITDALTIALWVRPDRIDGSTQILVSKDNAYELEFGKLAADRWDLRLNNQLAALAPTPLEPQVWQHIAATWDGTDIKVYYNGLIDGGGPFAATLNPNNNDLSFGARPFSFGGGVVFPFEGALDEIYVYNRVLDDTEIAQLVLDTLTDIAPPMRSNLMPTTSQPLGTTSVDLTLDTDENATCRYDTVPGTAFDDMANVFSTTGSTAHSSAEAVAGGQIYEFYVRCRDVLGNTNNDDVIITFGVEDSDLISNLLATWDFNEGSGCVAGDSTSGFDGALGPNCPTNAPTWSTGHDGGAALTFDQNDDRVSVPNAPTLATPAEVTMAAWVRHPGNLGFRSIIDMRDSGTDGYDLYVQPGSKGFIRVNTQTLTGNTVIGDGIWHHVVGTYDGNALRIYVDGVLDATSVIGPQAIDVSADLQIGRHFQVLNNTLGGELSQVRIYARALNDTEVLDLYLLTQ